MRDFVLFILWMVMALPLFSQTNADEEIAYFNNGNIRDGYYITPNIYIHRCDSYYIIDYCPDTPSVAIQETFSFIGPNEVATANFDFNLFMQDLFDVGYPALPYYHFSLLIPNGTNLQSIIAMSLESCDTTAVTWDEIRMIESDLNEPTYNTFTTLTAIYRPAQICFNSYPCELFLQDDYYNGLDLTWNNSHYIYDVDTIGYMNSIGLNFSIFPLRYIPNTNELQLLGPTRFYIKYDCTDPMGECNLINTLNLNSEDFDVVQFYESYNIYEKERVYPPQEEREDYLIITENGYADSEALTQFVEHKQALGYNVHVVSFSNLNVNDSIRREAIKSTIINYYQSCDYLRYVLLVGSYNALPPSAGIILNTPNHENTQSLFAAQAIDPPTDIYYECFYSSSDNSLTPRISCGRWLVDRYEELSRVVHKTINEEFRSNSRSIAIFSGTKDGDPLGNRRFISDCDLITSMMSNTGAYVTNTIGALVALNDYGNSNIIDVLNNMQYWMFLYRGHSSVQQYGNPYLLSGTQLNDVYCPFAFGQTCLSNSFYSSSFGKVAVNNSENGFCTYYGAASYAYSEPSSSFSKILFEILSEHPTINYPIGRLISLAEQKYYTANQKDFYHQQLVKTFHLLGDPSLYIYGITNNNLDQNTLFSSRTEKKYDSKKIDISQLDKTIFLYNQYGQLVLVSSQTDFSQTSLSSGIYIQKTVDINGDAVGVNKLIIIP